MSKSAGKFKFPKWLKVREIQIQILKMSIKCGKIRIPQILCVLVSGVKAREPHQEIAHLFTWRCPKIRPNAGVQNRVSLKCMLVSVMQLLDSRRSLAWLSNRVHPDSTIAWVEPTVSLIFCKLLAQPARARAAHCGKTTFLVPKKYILLIHFDLQKSIQI